MSTKENLEEQLNAQRKLEEGMDNLATQINQSQEQVNDVFKVINDQIKQIYGI